MTQIRYKKIIISVLLLLGIGSSFVPGKANVIAAPSFTGIALILFTFSYRRKSIPKHNPIRVTEIALPRIVEKQVIEDTAQLQIASLGSAHRKSERQGIETVIEEILDAGIKLIKAKIDSHTVAIFFPTGDGGFKLRRFNSTSEHINSEAVIHPGVGVIGGFLKDGLKQLNLHEIMSDSMTLYYYTKDAGIRSLMASTITAGKADRGTIIVDSTHKKHFSDEDHAYLSLVASIIGQAVFSTYLYSEHKLTHVRLAAMSSIEKNFFSNLTLNSILDIMTDVIPFAISCDRLTISIKNDDGTGAVIKRASGTNTEFFVNKSFSLKEKTLAGIMFSKNIALCRNFSKEHYEIRFCEDEPRNEEFNSFLAIPLGVDDCKGMILLESFKHDAFSESCKELLTRLSISAGLALEKIIVLEKAKTLATRDGLTGLRNHREFQQILKDEITRSIRYNDPLALVLCDIDFFKKLNDTWGHQFGDLVLKGISTHLESCIRDGVDTAARYGGEEFTLILVKNDERSAAETTERIRAHIAGLIFKSPTGEDVHVTMSFGIAIYRQHAKQIDELIKKADKALYRAKDNGRNRVEVF
jgi:diguanylate cyclase (GGDEF)-like protein